MAETTSVVQQRPVLVVNRKRLDDTMKSLLIPLLEGDDKEFDTAAKKIRAEIASKKLIVEGFKYVDFNDRNNKLAVLEVVDSTIKEFIRVLQLKLGGHKKDFTRKTYL